MGIGASGAQVGHALLLGHGHVTEGMENGAPLRSYTCVCCGYCGMDKTFAQTSRDR